MALGSTPVQQLTGKVIQSSDNPLDRYKHVISEALRLRNLKGERDWPEFLSTMGLNLQGFPFPENEPKGLLGHVNGRPLIVFNNSLCLSRQEMTYAHELAHWVLKHQPALNRLERQQQETEAEVFAFWMTYPMELDSFKHVWEENPELRSMAALQSFCLVTGGILYAAFHGLNWIAERWKRTQK